MTDFWNNRFKTNVYVYGTNPNVHVQKFIDTLSAHSTILFPGEGEGRNAVYAAQKGHKVIAYDQSTEAQRKAQLLANQNNVSIDYQTGNILESDLEANSFDAIVLCFMHLPVPIRQELHHYFLSLLKPGGFIYLIGFSTQQLDNNYTSGGPKDRSMLYTKGQLKQDFDKLNMIQLEVFEEILSEGVGHQGNASLLICKAVKN